MKLEFLSDNLIIMINKILEDENGDYSRFVKLLADDRTTALTDPKSKLTSNKIILQKSNPEETLTLERSKQLFNMRVYPFHTESFQDDERSELRVYFPSVEFESGGVIENSTVLFDIVTHRNLYLVKSEEGKTIVRPHAMACEIIHKFHGKSIDTVGRIHFKRLINLEPSEKYQVSRLQASMMTIGR